MSKVAYLAAAASLIALAGCRADAVSPTPLPTGSEVLTGTRPECEIDPVVFPEFDGQVVHPVLLHDGSGLVTGCRHVGLDEQAAILETFGPPLPNAMRRGAAHVAHADVEGTRVLVLWVILGCDEEARVVVSARPAGLAVDLTQLSEGRCAPGTGLSAIEISFREAISIEDVAVSYTNVSGR